MMKTEIIGILILALFMCQTVSAYSVSPAKWEVTYDKKIVLQKVNLVINNNDNASISIRLSITASKSITTGYEPLPKEDYSWIKFNSTDITISPHAIYTDWMTIDVPNATENYGKNWQFYIYVEQYAGGEQQGTTTMLYDYNLNWRITTPSLKNTSNSGVTSGVNQMNVPWLFIISLILVIIILAVAVVVYRKEKKNRDDESPKNNKYN